MEVSRLESLKRNLVEWGALGFEVGRGAGFLAQMRALQWITGGFPTRIQDPELERRLLRSIFELFREDARAFAQGRYPLSMLKPEGPLRHGLRLSQVLVDGLRVVGQKRRGRTTEFSDEARDRITDKPRYYRRNFHFQADGYLSERSARLYEHQVEILFTGAGDAMRRLALEPLMQRWGNSGGRGIRILEIGAGTGRASRFVKQALPHAHLTVSDLSEVYLQHARSNLADFERVDFVEAAGEALPFQDRTFDAVVSVFLFHELPLEVRVQVLREMGRVVRLGGPVVAVDSLQLHDEPDYVPVLEQFHQDFHEPFYRNYLENPLESLFAAAGLQQVQHSIGFVSKRVVGTGKDLLQPSA